MAKSSLSYSLCFKYVNIMSTKRTKLKREVPITVIFGMLELYGIGSLARIYQKKALPNPVKSQPARDALNA